MIAIEVNNLIKIYRLYNSPKDRLSEIVRLNRIKYHHEFYALNDVSFSVNKGEATGIVGLNGSGKSTLLKIICGVTIPTSGTVKVNGRVSSLLELGAGFHPEFTGRENVYMNGALMGLSLVEIEQRLPEIEAFADIGEFIEQPVKTYSSGMFVRLAFATAINLDSDILIIDEALSVGDMQFQMKCMKKMGELKSKGKTILFVSHNLYAVRVFCEKCIWLKNGHISASGEANEIVNRYIEETQDKGKVASGKEGNNILSSRWGSGEVEVIGAKIYDDKGNENYVFKTGDDVILEVIYYAKGKIHRPTFAYSIYTKDDVKLEQIRATTFSTKSEQIRVTSYSTKWDGCSPTHIIGQGIARVRLNAIPLLPGYYSFLFAIRDEYDLVEYDLIMDLIGFRIIEANSKLGIMSTCGIMYYPTKWEFVESELHN